MSEIEQKRAKQSEKERNRANRAEMGNKKVQKKRERDKDYCK